MTISLSINPCDRCHEGKKLHSDGLHHIGSKSEKCSIVNILELQWPKWRIIKVLRTYERAKSVWKKLTKEGKRVSIGNNAGTDVFAVMEWKTELQQ